MKHIIWQPWSEKWISNAAGMSEQEALQEPDQNIF